jgi:phytol kinase
VIHLPPFGTPAGELARAALMMVAMSALLGVVELWHRAAHPPVEWTRKLAHAGSGVAAAFLPWLFAWHWTVLALCALMVALLLVSRGRFTSVTGVERQSRGDLWFPIVVYLLFAVARHQPVFYLIALSCLTVSDTVAALLGRVYGLSAFTVEGSVKSLEGSAAFFVVTFLAVHLTLLLATPLDRTVCVIVAFQIALLTTSAEAISVGGSDNLVIPLGAYYLLLKMTPKPAPQIAVQLLVQIGLLLVMQVVLWRTRLVTLGGAIAAHLVLYAAFSLGGPMWVVAPAGALATFIVLDHRRGGQHGVPRGGHEVLVIYYVAVVAVLVLFADNSFATLLPLHPRLASGHPFYPLFTGALAATVAILAFEVRDRSPSVRRASLVARLAAGFAIGTGAVLVPGLAVLGAHATFETVAVAVLPIVVGMAAYAAWRGRMTLGDPLRSHLRLQALCVLLAVAMVLPLHLAWIGIEFWKIAR